MTVHLCSIILFFSRSEHDQGLVLRLRVGLLHICNVVVKDGLLVTAKADKWLRDGRKWSEPKFFKEGEFIGRVSCF